MKRELTAAASGPIVFATLAVAIFLGAGAAYGQSADAAAAPSAATIAQMQAQIQALQNRVNALESNPKEEAADRAAATEKVLQDADQHSQLLPVDSLASGYDPNVGFVIRSPDGQFSLHPGLTLDVRNMTSYRANASGGETAKSGYDTQNGFDLTRLRLIFDGNYTKQLNYFLQFQDDQGSTFGLLDAYGIWHFGDQSAFSVKFGQFKDPVWHERNLSEANLLAVDRSLVEFLLGGGQTSRVQGVSLVYDQDRLRGQLVVHDGYNSTNTKFFDSGGLPAGVSGGAGVTPTDYGLSGRVEYMLIGDRNAHSNPYVRYDGGFTALGVDQDYLIVGGGYDYSEAGDNNIIFHTVDAQYASPSGLSLYGAYLGTYRNLHSSQGITTGSPSVPPGNFYDPGFLAQAAYLLTPKIEPFVRYDYTYLDGGSVAGFGLNKNDAQEFTVGSNYYLYKQHVKFTIDGSWLPEGSPVDADALGILKDSGHTEYVLRFQFQLSI
jgi:hypothetical protein